MQYLIREIRRRNILRVAGVYGVLAWLLVQLATVLETSFFLAEPFDHAVLVTLLAGFPVVLAAAWTLEVTPDGIRPYGTNDVIGKIEDEESGTDAVMAGAFALLACFVTADIVIADRAVPLSEAALEKADQVPVDDKAVVELPPIIETAEAAETELSEDAPTGSVLPSDVIVAR